MPLTEFQEATARLLSANRTESSHLAGGAALHLQPNSKRYSNDLDYFHDSAERVATAFASDLALLSSTAIRYTSISINRATSERPSRRVRARRASNGLTTRHGVFFRRSRARSSATSYTRSISRSTSCSHSQAATRPRDFLDILMIDHEVLPLGALCWARGGERPWILAAVASRASETAREVSPEDFERLRLSEPVDLQSLKRQWLEALQRAETFIDAQDPTEIGCLFYDAAKDAFVAPTSHDRTQGTVVPHFGRPGGILPSVSRG